MERIRIVLAEDNRELSQILSAHIQKQPNMKIVGVADNGRDALELIKKENPDVLLLDIIMPYLDGIGVLQELKKLQLKPKVIILSAFGQEALTKTAVELGVDYFLLKPFELEILVQRINEIMKKKEKSDEPSRHPQDPEIELLITQILSEIGIPMNCQGFQYVREAILLSVQDFSLLNKITLKVYPIIAERHKTTIKNVERSIRFAIEKAWNQGKIDAQQEIFGYSINEHKGKPTNALFIAQIADKIRLEIQQKSVKKSG